MLHLVVTALTLSATPAQAHCFDVELPTGRYLAEPVCASGDALHASLPRCVPIEVAVVDGCLAFPFGEISEAVDTRVIKRGRTIARQLVARDSCGTHWDLSYRTDGRTLSVSARAGSRCGEVALTKDGDKRVLKRGVPLDDIAARAAMTARDLLGLSEGQTLRAPTRGNPSACERLSTTLQRGSSALVEQILVNVDGSGACLQPEIERRLSSRPRLAQKALTRIASDDDLEAIALREIEAGRSVVALIKALKSDPDRVLPLREKLKAQLARRFRPASLALLELDPELGAAAILEAMPVGCNNVSFALSLFEVQAALKTSKSVERTFIPLLARDGCPEVRRMASEALVVRLAEGRAASPAAWRALFGAMERDELLARQLKRSLKSRFNCEVRRDDVSLPAFAYDKLLELSVRVPCAQLGPLEIAETEPPEDSNDPAAAALVDPAAPVEDTVEVHQEDLLEEPPDEPLGNRGPKPRALEEMMLSAYGAVALQRGGGLGGIGLGGAWMVDEGFGFVANVTLGLMCAECFSEEQVHRRDLRFALGVRTLWFPDEPWTPYVLGTIVLGDSEIASDARSARSFLIGADIGLGLEWLMTDDIAVFADLSAFILGEAETSFPSGIPQASGIPSLGREQVGALLKVGVGWRL